MYKDVLVIYIAFINVKLKEDSNLGKALYLNTHDRKGKVCTIFLCAYIDIFQNI